MYKGFSIINSTSYLLSLTLILIMLGCGGSGESANDSIVTETGQEHIPDPDILTPDEPEVLPEPDPKPDPDTQDIQTEEISINIKDIPNLQYQNVSNPVTTVIGGVRPLLAPNADGTWDYVASYYSSYWYNQEVLSIDMGTHKVNFEKREGNEAESGYAELWTGYYGAVAKNGKLFIITRSVPNWLLHVYNPQINSIEKTISLPAYMTGGVSMIRTGIDGYIYAASGREDSGYVTAIRINPSTLEIQSYGRLGNSNAGQAEHIYADATHIYIAAGRSPYSIISVPISAVVSENTTNSQGSVLGSTSGIIEIFSSTYGASTQIGSTKYWLYNGKLNTYSAGEPWSNGSDGKAYVWDTYPEDAFWPNKPEFDNTLMGGDKFNKLWFKNPKDEWESVEFEGPTYSQIVHRIAKLDDDTFIGSGDAYSGMYLHDPKTEISTFLGHTGLSHYTTTVYKSKSTGKEKVFMSGYPNSAIMLFEPEKPTKTKITENYHPGNPESITPDEELNPKFIGSFYQDAGCKKMYASAEGADGNIYFGGKWRDNGTAGCLGWINAETEVIDGFYDIFTNYQVRDITSTGNKKYIVIATTGIPDETGSKPTPTKGRIFIYDTSKDKTQTMMTIDPTDNIDAGAIVGVEGNMVVGIVRDVKDVSGYVYKVDASTGKIIYRKRIDLPISVSPTSNQYSGNPIRYHNNVVWFNGGGAWTDKYLVKVLENGKMRAIGKIPRPLNAGDFEFVGNDMYSAGETSMRKVSNIFNY